MRTLRVFTASLFLMGCGQMNQATLQPSAQTLSVQTASKPRWHSIGQPGVLITPEGVEAIARERATRWSEDSELRFVAWGMVGNERLSAVNHSFFSPSKRQVMVVATFLKETQQKVVTYGDPELVKPMDALLPLSKIKLDAQAALTLAAPYFLPGNTNPLRMLTLTHPRKFAYPLWSVASGGNMVHVNASTGTVIGVKPFKSEYPLAWRDQRR
ncbi:MAG: hypothetical protein VKN33_03875 [Candidatus Sericytochromatia bacterium]|nr:hypothetical protein [Candidatus Sericytochromatia bacterium]